jgi:hypothetical protein
MREDFIRLIEFDTGKTIEKDGKLQKVALFGLSTPGEELDRIEKEINGIFAGSNLFQNLCKEVKTRVFLLRYGIDQEELEENYRRLGRIKELFMEKDTTYEVSFDITHAFRIKNAEILVQQACVTSPDANDFIVIIVRSPDYRADCGVHARSISSAGKDSNCHLLLAHITSLSQLFRGRCI